MSLLLAILLTASAFAGESSEQGCVAGNEVACAQLRTGLLEARALLTRACELGDASACTTAAVVTRSAPFSSADFLRFVEAEARCLGDQPEACVDAAERRSKGWLHSSRRTLHLLEVGCAAGFARSCANQARLASLVVSNDGDGFLLNGTQLPDCRHDPGERSLPCLADGLANRPDRGRLFGELSAVYTPREGSPATELIAVVYTLQRAGVAEVLLQLPDGGPLVHVFPNPAGRGPPRHPYGVPFSRESSLPPPANTSP